MGVEFIIIFPESSIEDVKLIIEGVRLKIAQYDFEGIEHKTASFGLTAFKAGDTIETVVKRADNALYEAKESGRNRAVVN